MFKTFFVLSLLGCVLTLISMITDFATYPLFLSTLASAILFGALVNMQNRVIALEQELNYVKKRANIPDMPKITDDIYSGNK